MSGSLTPSRRTVLATAGWAVPTAAVATAAPAFATSSARTLTLSWTAPFAIAHSTSVTATLTDANGPVVGAEVTITLGPGLHRADGSTFLVGVTDAGGRLNTGLFYSTADVDAPSAVATHGSLTATAVPATVIGTVGRMSRWRFAPGARLYSTIRNYPDTQVTTLAVGAGMFLTRAGELLLGGQGASPAEGETVTTVATGVTSARAEVRNTLPLVTYVDDAARFRDSDGTVSTVHTSTDASTTVVGHEATWHPDGSFHHGNWEMSSIATAAVATYHPATGQVAQTYVSGSDAYFRRPGSGVRDYVGMVDKQPLGLDIFRLGGQLWLGKPLSAPLPTHTVPFGRDGLAIRGITSVDVSVTELGEELITYGTAGLGVLYNRTLDTLVEVPNTTGFRAVGPRLFLSPSGVLRNDVQQIDINVLSATSRIDADGYLDINYVKAWKLT